MSLRVVPVTPERWDDMVTLFERRGPRGGHRNAPGYGCWCMYWRDRSLEHGEPKKRAMADLVRAGREPGLLAYDGDEPVGWVSVAPREEFHALVSSPQYGPDDEDEGVWSIVCFVVDKPRRGAGVAAELLGAAVEHALARGASAIEAYPHVRDGRDYMGHVPLFEQAGFEKVRDANKRVIMRTKGMRR
ncbi:MAG TPA: GNAT family N-acetyltransferase [Gaiellaceae bacterium]|nr:GNAT family N-acetyltransferase [Gaiellaceae bacterium]